MKKGIVAMSLILALLAIAGCGTKTYKAQPINEDVDVCVICNMQVKDDAYATQIVTKEGKSLKFDDIGCMNEWKKQNGTDDIGMDYVRDYNDKEWIEFKKATYVYDPSIRTPMAYGIISFKNKESAEQFIKEQGVGQLLSSADLANHSWEQSKDMMDMHMHNEGEGQSGSHAHDGDMGDMMGDGTGH
ncbi:nitrous oxide reductase accessory protein NosL [Paenibacillus macerans]|uniref:nitrous oxide reductase accessory protein NosL n=1 Tax=Paenibacillus macerans TaxID=44252 RepID=UPI002040D83A|nr:nitrous oxide reductase accessory protein NosL [Paenibacillus macerans]MCM3701659.1 nitrous oxide reductase accessory protein NosL [Paenibacillus macerans]